VRFLLALTLLVAVAFLGVAASSSCVIDARQLDADIDGEAGDVEVVDAGFDGDVADVELDCGCCNQAVLPSLTYCTGKVGFEVYAKDCKVSCSGPVRYVLCGGGCFTVCACELPAGYTLLDAGIVLGEADAENSSDASQLETGADAHGDL
jgi:hypothetical protein